MSVLEIDLIQRRSRGARAKALLADEIFSETMADLEARFIREWRNAPSVDADALKEFHIRLNLLDEIRHGIQAIADDGKMAELEINTPIARLNMAAV